MWAFLSGAAGTPPRPAAVIGASFFALYAPLHGDEASVRADLAAAVAAGAGTDFVVDLTPRCGGSDADGTNPRASPARHNGASSAVAPTTPTLRVVLRPCVAPSLDDDAPAVIVPAGAAADDDGAPPLNIFFAFLAPIATDAVSSVTTSVAASGLTSSFAASHTAADSAPARAESCGGASSLQTRATAGSAVAPRGCACVIC